MCDMPNKKQPEAVKKGASYYASKVGSIVEQITTNDC